MSRFTYERLRPFTVRSVTPVNLYWTAFTTAATALDQENFAEEGLDVTAFVDDVANKMLHSVQENTRAALAASASFITYNPNGTNLRTPSIGDIDAGTALRITSTSYFESTPTNQPGLPRGALMEQRHAWRSGGATSAVACSRGKATAGLVASNQDTREHRTISIESWMFGPITGIDWVEVQYALSGAGVAYPSKSLLIVDAFYQAKVV
jgi:hypothetical protein